MEDRQTKKIKKYFEIVQDEGEDLSQTIKLIINTAGLQVQALLNTQATLLQKEAVLNYLTKITSLFTELNHSGLKFLESEPPPVTTTTEHVQGSKESQIQAQSPSTIQDLNDRFKVNVDINISMCDSDGPKILNNQVVNDSCISKPLDNTILKAICSNLINHGTNPDSRLGAEGDLQQVPIANNTTLPSSSVVSSIIEAVESNSCQAQEHVTINPDVAQVSPAFSSFGESETVSTVSSVAYQHPLAKFKPLVEIPKQYDSQNLEKIRENLNYLSKKMGFDADSFSQMKDQFNKVLPNFEYEEPVKEKSELKAQLKEEIEVSQENRTEPSNTEEVTIPESTVPDQNESKLSSNLAIAETAVPITIRNNNLSDSGPSSSTGAVRKQQLPIVEDLIEFSDPTESDSKICEKVTSWLSNNRLFEQKRVDASEITSTDEKTIENSAIEKLHCVQRHDRNAEVREQAMSDMPDLRLVPVEVPRVIRNDLNSDNDSSEKRSIGKKKQSKDLNKENAVYEIKKMETPGEEDICIFSHVESPNEFYLQILDDTRTEYLDEISEKLNSKFRKTETLFNTKLEAFNKLGKFCCGYILGDKAAWYRLQVLDWQLGLASPDVIVKCIDYGFKCRTSYQYLREMAKDLTHIPMLAVQCHFPLLYPPGSTYSHRLTEWPQVTVESICDMVNLNHGSNLSDVKMFVITLAELEGDSLAVDLVPFAEQNPDSLRNLLLDSGLAVDIIEDYGEHPELGEFLEDVETLEEPANINELVLGYDAKDEMRICRFTRSDGTCYKGKNCKLEHIPLKGTPVKKKNIKKKRPQFKPFLYPG